MLFQSSIFYKGRANGLRYLRVGGRGQCLGAGKTQSEKMLETAAESHTACPEPVEGSGARFVGTVFDGNIFLDYFFKLIELGIYFCVPAKFMSRFYIYTGIVPKQN